MRSPAEKMIESGLPTLGGNPAMNQSVIAASIQNHMQKLKQFRFAELRARQIIGVFALIAVLCIAGCGSANSNTAPMITLQPVSVSAAALGAMVTFSAGASGNLHADGAVVWKHVV